MSVYIYTFIYLYLYLIIYLYLFIYLFLFVYVFIYLFIYHLSIYLYYLYLYLYYLYIYIYICIYMYINIKYPTLSNWISLATLSHRWAQSHCRYSNMPQEITAGCERTVLMDSSKNSKYMAWSKPALSSTSSLGMLRLRDIHPTEPRFGVHDIKHWALALG